MHTCRLLTISTIFNLCFTALSAHELSKELQYRLIASRNKTWVCETQKINYSAFLKQTCKAACYTGALLLISHEINNFQKNSDIEDTLSHQVLSKLTHMTPPSLPSYDQCISYCKIIGSVYAGMTPAMKISSWLFNRCQAKNAQILATDYIGDDCNGNAIHLFLSSHAINKGTVNLASITSTTASLIDGKVALEDEVLLNIYYNNGIQLEAYSFAEPSIISRTYHLPEKPTVDNLLAIGQQIRDFKIIAHHKAHQ